MYLTVVFEETLAPNGPKEDALVCFYDVQTHYELGKEMLKKRDFTGLMFYEDETSWKGKERVKAYLKNNIYISEGKRYIHAWAGHILPVKVIGIGDDDVPIVEYMEEWHYLHDKKARE